MTPLERLGLPAHAGERAVKRAYAALLRVNHPEENPQGFAALHAAYRAALRWVQMRDASPAAAASRAAGDSLAAPVRDAGAPVSSPAPVAAALDSYGGARPRASTILRRPEPAAVSAPAVPLARPLDVLRQDELERLLREIRSLVDDPRVAASDLAQRLATDERLQPFTVHEWIDEALLHDPPPAVMHDTAKLRVLTDHFGWRRAAEAAPIGSPAAVRRGAAAYELVARLDAAESAAAAERRAAASAAAAQRRVVEAAVKAYAALAAPRRIKRLLERMRGGATDPPIAVDFLLPRLLPMGLVKRWLWVAFVERGELAAALSTLQRQGGAGALGLFHRPTLDFFAELSGPRLPVAKRLLLFTVRSAVCGGGMAVLWLVIGALSADAAMEVETVLALVTVIGVLTGGCVFLCSIVMEEWRTRRSRVDPHPLSAREAVEEDARARRRRHRWDWTAGAGAVAALCCGFLSLPAAAWPAAAAALFAVGRRTRRPAAVIGLGILFGLAAGAGAAERFQALSMLVYCGAWLGMDLLLARWRSQVARTWSPIVLLGALLLLSVGLTTHAGEKPEVIDTATARTLPTAPRRPAPRGATGKAPVAPPGQRQARPAPATSH